jgi:hypothetical protein
MVVAGTEARVLHLLTRFPYLMVLNIPVASSVSRLDVEAHVPCQSRIPAAIDDTTSLKLLRLSFMESEASVWSCVSYVQLNPVLNLASICGACNHFFKAFKCVTRSQISQRCCSGFGGILVY